jgi:hypothetical protein
MTQFYIYFYSMHIVCWHDATLLEKYLEFICRNNHELVLWHNMFIPV